MGFWGFFSLPVALSGVTMCDSPHTPPDICGKRVSTPKTTPIQDAVEPSSSEVVFKHRPVGNVINIPAGSVPQKRPVPISGVTRRVQGVGTHGASPALPASTGTPLLIPPGLGAGICRHKQKAGKIPNGCGNSFLNLGGAAHAGHPQGHPNSHIFPSCRASCCLQAKESCAGTQPSSSSSSCPGQSHPHHGALDKLPFKGVCLIPYLPSVRSRSSCRRGRGGRHCRALLSYELFLTHVYNFHKSFLQHGERKKGGGEGERERGRRSSLLQQKPLARWAGREGRQGRDVREYQGEPGGISSSRRRSAGTHTHGGERGAGYRNLTSPSPPLSSADIFHAVTAFPSCRHRWKKPPVCAVGALTNSHCSHPAAAPQPGGFWALLTPWQLWDLQLEGSAMPWHSKAGEHPRIAHPSLAPAATQLSLAQAGPPAPRALVLITFLC